MTEWMIPSNPSYFDVDEVFHEHHFVDWEQNSRIKNLQAGDVVYFYISSPVQEVHWKAEVLEVNVTYPNGKSLVNTRYTTGPYARLIPQYEFHCTELVTYQKLRENGLNTRLQSACRVNPQLSQYLAYVESLELDESKRDAYYQSLSATELKALADDLSKKAKRIKRQGYAYSRNSAIAAIAKQRANGHCQLCGKPAPFLNKQGQPFLEAHHIVPLSKDGYDSLDNVAGLCPNCHRKMHALNDPADVRYLLNLVK